MVTFMKNLDKKWLEIIGAAMTGLGIIASLVGGVVGKKSASLEMKEEVSKEVARQLKEKP
jgi:hypothetical protein